MPKFTKEFGLRKIRGAPVKKHPVGEGIITFKREMVLVDIIIKKFMVTKITWPVPRKFRGASVKETTL